MIVEFTYQDLKGKPSRPLVFVMDTDEYLSRNKKVFHGVNLNYIPPTAVERLFENILTKTNFEMDKETKFPKLNLYEEEDPSGLRPRVIYKPFVKQGLMNRYDCWRSYKYINVRNVKQIKWNFKSKKLSKAYKNMEID